MLNSNSEQARGLLEWQITVEHTMSIRRDRRSKCRETQPRGFRAELAPKLRYAGNMVDSDLYGYLTVYVCVIAYRILSFH